ncbi:MULTISPECIES: hypothetical protein [unclassified Rhodococcus (in: high G+C Gram-positive bacteria)]|uniref:hypothetical protein n=1 Tax=unclassified Rhodococcus (in: high G+C Gram-positive bacteria) TaxID=192944 RepID=UPI0012F4B79E|nr:MULTISPECIES: hypothetical protein [unclassified Rhodococcus (in: high G+C Gram-positive bacteria)]
MDESFAGVPPAVRASFSNLLTSILVSPVIFTIDATDSPRLLSAAKDDARVASAASNFSVVSWRMRAMRASALK